MERIEEIKARLKDLQAAEGDVRYAQYRNWGIREATDRWHEAGEAFEEHAYQDVKVLLEEIERLEAENARLREALEEILKILRNPPPDSRFFWWIGATAEGALNPDKDD